MTRPFDRVSKALVLLSLGAAILMHAEMVSHRWSAIGTTAAGAFAAACVGALAAEPIAASTLMLEIYLFPTGWYLLGHGYSIEDNVVWSAALFGIVLPRAIRSGWSVPWRWRTPLVLWALTVAVAWPLVVLRETDFQWSFAELPNATSHVGIAAASAIVWVLDVATATLIGIVWFDWSFGAFERDEGKLRRYVIVPLAVSGLVAILVGIYQGFGDIEFLNTGLFGFMRRASGTLRDANPFGIVSALWGAVVVAWLAREVRPSSPVRAMLAGLALALSWAGVWASGSRTAFGSAAVIAVLMALAVAIEGQWLMRLARHRLVLAGGAVAVGAGLWLAPHLQSAGPLARMTGMFGRGPVDTVQRLLDELWFRNGYGEAAAIMMDRHPLVGVGLGSFHYLLPDYSFVRPGIAYLVPDNAQNWFRHQFVELGLLGSVGWIMWTLAFGWWLARARPDADSRLAFRIVAGAVVALALVSLGGVPTQSAFVNLTFWIMAAWLARLGGAPTCRDGPMRQGRRATAEAVIVVLLVCAFGAGTVLAGLGELRPPARAAKFGWEYVTGMYPPDASGERVARRRAVAVVAAPTGWLEVTFSVNHFDVAAKPVHVQLWNDGRLACDRMLGDIRPVTGYIRARTGVSHVRLETLVSRTLRPSDLGFADNRELGLFIKWQPVDRPPDGASVWP